MRITLTICALAASLLAGGCKIGGDKPEAPDGAAAKSYNPQEGMIMGTVIRNFFHDRIWERSPDQAWREASPDRLILYIVTGEGEVRSCRWEGEDALKRKTHPEYQVGQKRIVYKNECPIDNNQGAYSAHTPPREYCDCCDACTKERCNAFPELRIKQ